MAQKQYIVTNLYPTLTKTLVHFIGEAKRMDQIEEKLEVSNQLSVESVTQQAANTRETAANQQSNNEPVRVIVVNQQKLETAKIERMQSPIRPKTGQASAAKPGSVTGHRTSSRLLASAVKQQLSTLSTIKQ